jgi:hypothetical protein
VSLGFAAIAVRQLRLALMFQGDQQKRKIDPWSAKGSKTKNEEQRYHG